MRVAWMSIVLGVIIEIALILVAVGFGRFGGLPPFLADLVGKISWSVIVCMGIAVGNAVAKHRPVWTGIFGLLSAPLAFAVAKATHKSAAQGLSVQIAASMPGPLEMMLLRGVEYLILGLAVAWLTRQSWPRFGHFAAVGLGTGVCACVYVVARTATSDAPLSLPVLVSKGVNEVLFPLGCAIVLFSTTALATKAASSAA